MVRVSPSQPSFASGEISPHLHGRPDFARHQNGVEFMRGFQPLAEGVATRLPGTRFMGYSHSENQARLVPAVLNDRDSYMLEFTDQVMRVWRERTLVESGGSPFTLGLPYGYSLLKDLQYLPNGDRLFLVEGSLHPRRLTRFDHDNWTIDLTPFELGPYLSQNLDKSKEIVASGVTGSVSLTSNFDIFESGHIGGFFALGEVNGDSVPNWVASQTASVGARRRRDDNVYEIDSFDGGGGSGNVGTVPPEHDEGTELASDGGPFWTHIHNGLGHVTITAVAGPRSATATVVSELPASAATGSGTYRWREGAWSDKNGYPGAIAENDQRFIYGGTSTAPLLVHFSQIGNGERFRPSTLADEAFSYQLAPNRRRQSKIRWMDPAERRLHIGTASGEYVGEPTDRGQGFTVETTRFDPSTTRGINDTQPVNVDGKPVFLSPDGLRIHGLRYVFEDDRVAADALNVAARHILYPGGAWLAWQERPWRVLWVGLTDGNLVGITYEPDQAVIGFGKHNLGGFVEWGAVKPTDDDTSEELWLQVRRAVQGTDRQMVEIMGPPFGIDRPSDAGAPALQDAWHLMSAVRYEGPATTVIGGLGHLESEEVWAWTELKALGPYTVQAGQITLDQSVTSAIVGKDVSDQQRLRLLDIAPGAADGGSQGRMKVMRGVGARLIFSAGGTARTIQNDSRGTLRESAPFRLARRFESQIAATGLFSGIDEVDPSFGWSESLQVEFRPEPGAPLTIAGVTPTVMVSDG